MAKKKNQPPAAAAEVEDIHELFCHYNSLYFDDSLGACIISWDNSTSSRTCSQIQQDGVCDIHLSRRLKSHPAADLKNTLLHEMIHAYLWLKDGNADRNDHGLSFQALMNSINSSPKIDSKKPPDGYKITASHALNNKKVDNSAVDCWTCELCGELINGTGSENKCVDNVGPDESCSNASCHWHRHKEQCHGSYTNPRKRAKRDERLNHAGNEELNEHTSSTVHSGQASGKSQEAEENLDSGKSKTITKFFKLSSDANRKSLMIVEPRQTPHKAEKEAKAKVSESNDHDVILYKLSHMGKLTPTKSNNNVTSSKVKKRVKMKADESEKDNGQIKFPEVTDDCRRSRSKPIYTSTKKRKYGKQMHELTVRSQWIEMYLDEEDDEEIVPLINHRSEMRKKQKLMKEHLSLQRCTLHMLNEEPANIRGQRVDAATRIVAVTPNLAIVCKDVEGQDDSAGHTMINVIDLSD